MQPGADILDNPPLFCTTSWTLILSCRQAHPQAASALNQLCASYWRPVFVVICRRGYSVPDAQDLTQVFFHRVMTADFVRHATAERGRFRAFLLTALRNFLADARDRKTRIKRGGDAQFLSFRDWLTESSQKIAMPAQAATWPDDRVFDWQWARAVAERAMSRLGELCEAEGARWIFDELKPYLGAAPEEPSYPRICAELSIPLSLLKRLLHKFRRRFAALLREEIAHTVPDPTEVESELRYLCSILDGSGA